MVLGAWDLVFGISPPRSPATGYSPSPLRPWHELGSLPSREPIAARASTTSRPDNLKNEHHVSQIGTRPNPGRHCPVKTNGRWPPRVPKYACATIYVSGSPDLQLSTPIYTYLHQKPRHVWQGLPFSASSFDNRPHNARPGEVSSVRQFHLGELK